MVQTARIVYHVLIMQGFSFTDAAHMSFRQGLSSTDAACMSFRASVQEPHPSQAQMLPSLQVLARCHPHKALFLNTIHRSHWAQPQPGTHSLIQPSKTPLHCNQLQSGALPLEPKP